MPMDKIALTGLWKNTSKQGKTYISGTLGMAKVMIFANENKKGEKSPDYMMYLVPSEPKSQNAAPAAPAEPASF